MLGLGLLPGVSSFVEVSSFGAHYGPLVSLSSILKSIEVVP